MKCQILPPRKLYHPVLPYRSNGKLHFTLCRTCTDEMSVSKCEHSYAKRALIGSWCTPEIEKALEMGYQMLKVYEVWDYPVKSDPKQTTGKVYYSKTVHFINQNNVL